jgi:putative transposase
MPRQGRVVVPNWPHHVIQRGHNTQGVFRCDDDYAYYWQTLEEWKTTLACQV